MKENHKLKKKVLLQIGPYSAIGGVSVHIKRLSELLKDFYDFRFIDESPLSNSNGSIYNLRSKNLFKYIRLIKNSDIVHIHTGIWWLRCIHIFIAFLLQKKVIITVHSLSNLTNRFSIFTTQFFLLFADKTIIVSEKIAKVIKPKKACIVPAFVPPIMEKETKLPHQVLEVLGQNADKKIIVSNAFKLLLHKNQDLYGLDLLIDVARKIKQVQKKYKIIFVVASMNEKLKMFDSYSKIIKKEKLDTVISLIPFPLSFVRLMNRSDLVVRATNTDGDALTVREAIYLNRPVIASDVAERPEGTILFKNRDSKDLFLKIDEVLQNSEINKKADINLKDDNRINYQEYFLSVLNS